MIDTKAVLGQIPIGRDAPLHIEDDVANRVSKAAQILSNKRRVYIVEALAEEEATTLRAISERIASKEYGEDYDSSQRKNIYISFLQHHLPKMDDQGVVIYESDRKTIERGENFEEVLESLKRYHQALA